MEQNQKAEWWLVSLTRDDLEEIGIEASKVSNQTMEILAGRMSVRVCDHFWGDLADLVDQMGLPRKTNGG